MLAVTMIKMTPCMSVWCAQKNPFSSVRLRMLRVSILFYPELRFSGSALNFCLYLYVHDGKLLQPPFILGNAYFCGILLPVTTAWIFTSWLPFLYIFLELLFFFLVTWLVSDDPLMTIRWKENAIVCLPFLQDGISLVCCYLLDWEPLSLGPSIP